MFTPQSYHSPHLFFLQFAPCFSFIFPKNSPQGVSGGAKCTLMNFLRWYHSAPEIRRNVRRNFRWKFLTLQMGSALSLLQHFQRNATMIFSLHPKCDICLLNRTLRFRLIKATPTGKTSSKYFFQVKFTQKFTCVGAKGDIKVVKNMIWKTYK